MDFGLSAIGQIAIAVSQLDPAIAFYRDQLGMKFLFQVPGMAFFDAGGIRLMLTAAGDKGDTHNSIVYFNVADIGQAQHSLNARGVVFEREPALVARMPDHDLWITFFRDLDRNLLALMSEAPRGEAAVAG